MPKIFVSYRRTDSMAYTGRIYDRLVNAFGVRNIFKDVDDIPPGVDFRTVLDEALTKADSVLVIIGPQWLLTTDDYGKRRLLDPTDFVRLEVENALKRDDVLVIPVLVNNATMPPAESLPDSLKDLAYRNSVVVRNDPDFSRDINQLIDVIDQRERPSKMPRILMGLAALIALAVLAVLLLPRLTAPTDTTPPTEVAQSVETSEATPEITPTVEPTTAPEASPTVSEPTTETTTEATAEVTEVAAVDLTPTVLYPDGRLLQFVYNDTSFYVHNTSSVRLAFGSLSFEALDASGEPTAFRFDGAGWSRLSGDIFPDSCGAIEPPQFTDQLRPSDCKDYNAIVSRTVANDLFWRAETGSTEFRVLWDAAEIGRCAIEAGICEVRVPRA